MDDEGGQRDSLFRNAENATAEESSQARRTITMVRCSTPRVCFAAYSTVSLVFSPRYATVRAFIYL